MEIFHDVCTAYRKVHNTSGHHEDDFLSISKKKSFGKVWGVYYIHLWLGVRDNLTDFVISGLPSEAIIDSTKKNSLSKIIIKIKKRKKIKKLNYLNLKNKDKHNLKIGTVGEDYRKVGNVVERTT